jgi:hypothetical protein
VVTSGIGASEGPARILAAQLAEAGFAARFHPVSQFSPRAPSADLLVMFSQGLSPNALLALGKQHAFAARWLVTSVGAAELGLAQSAPAESRSRRAHKQPLLRTLEARGITPIVVPPGDEPEALARFMGPTVAALTALRLSALLTGDRALAVRLAEAPAAYVARPGASGSRASTPALSGALALITAGALAESAYAQRWKLLEALLGADPPVWDVLQFAHGPLQAFHDRPLTLLALEATAQSALIERLERTLVRPHHQLLRLRAELPAPLSFFQHTAQLDAFVLAQLELTPRDLFDWPGRHGDAPLYALGSEES